jgi:hypothetical protein
MTQNEEKVVRTAQEIADAKPEVRTPSLEFKREWAYGNAGLEDERITREQVKEAIKK